MHRRAFLQAAASGLAAGSVAVGQTRKSSHMPIVDTHQHLWDLSRFRLPWIKRGSPLAKNFVTTDYAKATEGLNVVKSVYMEVAVDPAQHDEEAEYVIDICKKGNTPMVAAVISGRPAAEGFRRYITRYKDNKYIKGVRQVLHEEGTKPGTCLDPKFIEGVRLLGELGMSFDLCVRPAELADAAKLVDACPDTRFILDHCGNANVQASNLGQWKKDMSAIARRKNVVCKISGIVASARPREWTVEDLAPIVLQTAEVFGKDRIMFGGDWPVCTLAATYAEWVAALDSIVRPWKDEEQRKLFHDNAVRFYGLS